MDASATISEMKVKGAGIPASANVVDLYHQAFAEFGTRALWNWRSDIAAPTITQALAIADSLRTEGNLQARRLAADIEAACRAAL